MKRCPECGEPPHYHSWCTLCAQLFMAKPASETVSRVSWCDRNKAMEVAVRLAYGQQMSAHQIARKIGCSPTTIWRWRRKLGLLAFRRKTYGHREATHALAS